MLEALLRPASSVTTHFCLFFRADIQLFVSSFYERLNRKPEIMTVPKIRFRAHHHSEKNFISLGVPFDWYPWVLYVWFGYLDAGTRNE